MLGRALRLAATFISRVPTVSDRPGSNSSTRSVGSVTVNAPRRCRAGARRARRAASSVDDLDEDALSFLDAIGLHDGAQRLGRAALAADHLAAVVLGDAQLEDDRVVVLLELVNLDLVRLVDQGPGEELEQLLQALIPLAFISCLTVSLGWAPCSSQPRSFSSSSSIVEGSVCGL